MKEGYLEKALLGAPQFDGAMGRGGGRGGRGAREASEKPRPPNREVSSHIHLGDRPGLFYDPLGCRASRSRKIWTDRVRDGRGRREVGMAR